MPSAHDTTHLQRLLDRYLTEEADAFDELIHYTTKRLRALARSMLARYPHVRRWEETDDVLQAAILRLHRSLKEVRPDSKRAFFGLAATQMRRTLIDLARHYYGVYGHGRNYHSDQAVVGSQSIGPTEPRNNSRPEDLQTWTEFHQAIERLPDDEQEVISLVWYGGLTQREVAGVLEVSERTVIRRMHRARLQLNEAMGGAAPQVDA